jgi:membrane protein implicated in regulation of membrane protease activity
MFTIRDSVDAILAGLFLFGLLLTLVSLLFGAADLGLHHGGSDGDVVPFSLIALLVTLTWLGGLGFLLRRAADWPLPLALLAAVVAAVAVGALVQRAIRALSRLGGPALEPERYRLPGVIGRVSSTIRPGGTGEVLYEQGGVRHVVAARAASPNGLAKGVEVVVLRVDRGTAIVDLFDPFDALGEPAATEPSRARQRPSDR